MRTPKVSAALAALLAVSLFGGFIACDGGSDSTDGPQCSDGKDNDGDGAADFPDDLGCISDDDINESDSASPKCSDGRDNDSDGLTDFPFDPGCTANNADDETDDCPDGPQCPQCGDGADNDGNGTTDYPQDTGCTSAADTDERAVSTAACGPVLMIQPLPVDGVVTGETTGTSISQIQSPCGGGGGTPAIAYELFLTENKVVTASTDDNATDFDTVIDIRSMNCTAADAEVACNDDAASGNSSSTVSASLTAGRYYIIVQGYDSTESGNFTLTVKQFAGQGAACTMQSDCGAGLFCRVPLGGSGTSCEKPQCDDGVDDDGDADGNDWPDDPGCTSKTDNDETDDCPTGPNCPECSDDQDNDGDNKTDFGPTGDPTCAAAGDASESCVSTDGVGSITTGMTMGTTTGAANDFTPPSASPSCASSTHAAPDKVFRLDLPATSTLTIDADGADSINLLGSTCAGAPLACKTFGTAIVLPNLAGGEYYLVADGFYGASDNGAFTVTVSGTIANNASCESALAQSGALTCAVGFTCKGTAGSRTCQPGLCGDGGDNDGDTIADYPNDPGCESLGDDTEANPATLPVCGNAIDEGNDGQTDYPQAMGCPSAAGASEVFCTGETDPTARITANPTDGTTVGGTSAFESASMCPTTNPATPGPDKAFGLNVPVFLSSLTIDLSMSAFDTVVTFRDPSCATQIACDDDGGSPGLQSKLVVSNVTPGNYAVVVDGWGTTGSTGAAGAFSMKVTGVAVDGQKCTDPGFSGADPLFKCETMCTLGVCN